MPDFTFTSPQGKSYTVSGPEGSTKEQAFEVLQSQLSAGTAHEDAAPAAAPADPGSQTLPAANPKAKALDAILQSENPVNKQGPMGQVKPSPTLAEAGKAIGASAAFGGVVGALSPEILTGIGMVLSAIPTPMTEAAAPVMMAAGAAARGARLASAGVAALSGAVGEAAGQGAEMAGATQGQANAARLIGGMGSSTAISAVEHFVPAIYKPVVKAIKNLAGEAPTEAKAVQQARDGLAQLDQSAQPQTAMHSMLQKGVEADRQAAQKAGDAVIAEANQRAAGIAQSDAATANRIVDEARTHADQLQREAAQRAAVLDKASDGKIKIANQVLAKAAPELAKVGQVQELSDIGTTIRQAATVKQGEQIAARSEAYQATVAERNAAVQTKEQAGESIDQTPAMQALRKQLTQKLGVDKGFVQTVDAGVRRGYEQVYNAITREGTDKTSFEAIDQVRRRLGDVIAGNPVEGYDAIGRQGAQQMYAQLAQAQREFAGPSQKVLQDTYREGTEGLTKFGSKAGQKLTAMDRLDPERFAGDPKALPGYFFSSRQGVQDLRELTGNPQLVDRMARDYTARSMQGMSAKQAENWMRQNSDWTREVPGLAASGGGYAAKLAQIERLEKSLGKRASEKAAAATATRAEGVVAAEKARQAGTARAGQVAEGTVATQERVLKEGSQAANAVQEQQFAPSKKLGETLSSGEAPESVRSLLLNGKPEQTRLAARHLAQTPGGQEVLDKSVRQVLRNMNEGQLQQQWTERVRPMLQEGRMIPPERLAQLNKDVNRLLTAFRGPEKKSLIQRHILAALGMSGGVGGMTEKPEQE